LKRGPAVTAFACEEGKIVPHGELLRKVLYRTAWKSPGMMTFTYSSHATQYGKYLFIFSAAVYAYILAAFKHAVPTYMISSAAFYEHYTCSIISITAVYCILCTVLADFMRYLLTRSLQQMSMLTCSFQAVPTYIISSVAGYAYLQLSSSSYYLHDLYI